MKNPAILWYPSDFISSTVFWTNEQCGAYIRLLNYQFILGHLSQEQLYQITKDEIVLSKFIKDKNGLFYNKRLEFEIEKRQKYSESRSKNKLGKTKENKKDMKNISKSYENHMGNENININKNIIYYNNIELNNIFKEFLQIRKKLKAINSDRAIKMLLNKLSKYDDETKYKIIEQSIVHSWKDIYELKEDKTIDVPKWFNKDYSEKNERILTEEDYERIRKIKEANRNEKTNKDNNV